MKSKQIFAGLFVGILFLILAHNASAQEYELLESMPGVAKTGESVQFPRYINGAYNFAVAFSVIGALLMITIGGFYYIVSAGNQAQAGTAKTIITDALLGLVVVFITWLILNTINSELLNTTPNLSGIQNAGRGAPNSGSIKQSTTVRGNTDNKPYDSEKECVAAGNSSCTPTQLAYDDTATYQKQSDGSWKKLTEDEARVQCGTSNRDACKSGAQIKADYYGTTKTNAQIEQNLKESGVDVADGVDPRVIAAQTQEAVKDVAEKTCSEKNCGWEATATSEEYSNTADMRINSGENAQDDTSRTLDEAEEMIDLSEKIGETTETTAEGYTKITETYVYPEGTELAGQKFDVVRYKDGLSTIGANITVYGEKVDAPKDQKLEDANTIIDSMPVGA